ncbi:MAG TPA: type II toxin-antitoxin system prevent-host-death family antitoxin [Phycisphaerae bacterium]|nr:type II toxin-antitoxin system prevent-host-death family antitoxin [Phycisphaerae bacterium]
MDVGEDILSLDDLVRDPKPILRKLRATGRPMVITVDGDPEAVLLSTELLPTKKTAIKAACELVGTMPV